MSDQDKVTNLDFSIFEGKNQREIHKLIYETCQTTSEAEKVLDILIDMGLLYEDFFKEDDLLCRIQRRINYGKKDDKGDYYLP